MGGATPVYNGKNILRVPLDFPFIKYLPVVVSEKLTICSLVSSGANFLPPSRNTDQLLQIDIKYVLDSYCIFITSPVPWTLLTCAVIIYQSKQLFNLYCFHYIRLLFGPFHSYPSHFAVQWKQNVVGSIGHVSCFHLEWYGKKIKIVYCIIHINFPM